MLLRYSFFVGMLFVISMHAATERVAGYGLASSPLYSLLAQLQTIELPVQNVNELDDLLMAIDQRLQAQPTPDVESAKTAIVTFCQNNPVYIQQVFDHVVQISDGVHPELGGDWSVGIRKELPLLIRAFCLAGANADLFADPFNATTYQATPFEYCVMDGKFQEMRELVWHRACAITPAKVDVLFNTLRPCAIGRLLDVVLDANNQPVDTTDSRYTFNGQTLLHRAAALGAVGIPSRPGIGTFCNAIRHLLRKGANPLKLDLHGKKPSDYVSQVSQEYQILINAEHGLMPFPE